MEFPPCANFKAKRECGRSALVLKNEGPDHWTFYCETCRLIQVVSKPTAIVRSRLQSQEEAVRKRMEERRRRERRPVYFT